MFIKGFSIFSLTEENYKAVTNCVIYSRRQTSNIFTYLCTYVDYRRKAYNVSLLTTNLEYEKYNEEISN
jgi:hypothetical protein